MSRSPIVPFERKPVSAPATATSERAQITRTALQLYQVYGTLTPPKGAKPHKKPRLKR